MKRTIIAALALTLGIVSFATRKSEPLLSKEVKTTGYTDMVVSADVTIVLLNDDSKTVRMEGDETFMKAITVSQKNGRLIIRSSTQHNYKKNGVIYVPARLLRFMEINSDAFIKSLTTLSGRQMDVVVNGNCKLVIATLGHINLIGTTLYDVEYDVREVRPREINARKE